MKLKTKIHLFSTLLMLIILTLTNVGIYFLFSKLAFDTEYDHLKVRSGELTTSISQMTTQSDPATVIRAYIPPNSEIRILDLTGNKVVSVHSAEGLEKFTPVLNEKKDYTITNYLGTVVLTMQIPIILSDGNVANLVLMKQLIEVEQDLSTLKIILFAVTIIAMIPITASSISLGKIVTQPIENLIHTMAQSRKSGSYKKIEIPSEGKDEMAQMGRTFNEMMEQLEWNYKKQEQFVSNASHELKTPLTVIESYSRLLSRRGFDDRSVAEEAIGAILSESVRMKEMIEQMLQLAKSNEHMIFDFTNENITDIVSTTVQPMRRAFGREFIIEETGPIYAMTDAKRLKQLLFIILDNARKYSQKEIKTQVMENENSISISVTDYGNGIPKDAIPHLFDRFYRVDEDRNRKTGGTGLGLSIAKEIADGLGIELTVESVVGMGTTFRIIMPKK